MWPFRKRRPQPQTLTEIREYLQRKHPKRPVTEAELEAMVRSLRPKGRIGSGYSGQNWGEGTHTRVTLPPTRPEYDSEYWERLRREDTAAAVEKARIQQERADEERRRRGIFTPQELELQRKQRETAEREANRLRKKADEKAARDLAQADADRQAKRRFFGR